MFNEIVEDFNSHSGHCKVVAIKEGNYQEIFEKGMAAEKPPHILQIYEVATLTAMLSSEKFVPVDELMKTYNKRFDSDVYIDAVRAFYTNPQGQMLSLPWNASTGIVFYNKTAFEKAGLAPPQTWEELEVACAALQNAGYVGYTTAWPAAYHLEHLCCWHNLPFATKGNGFEGLDARLIFNQKEQVHHIAKVAEWQQKGFFQYAGRFNEEPEQLFTNGTCAMLFQGANRLGLLERKVDFPIGACRMPYWQQFGREPNNLNIGGSSLWVHKGFSEEEYRAIAQFFEYLSAPATQAFWHQKTGYLPITDAAYHLTKKKGFYKTHPAAEIAVLEVMNAPPTPYTRGVRLGNYVKLRDRIVDHLERAFEGTVPAKQALDDAVEEGNQILAEFEKEAKK